MFGMRQGTFAPNAFAAHAACGEAGGHKRLDSQARRGTITSALFGLKGGFSGPSSDSTSDAPVLNTPGRLCFTDSLNPPQVVDSPKPATVGVCACSRSSLFKALYQWPKQNACPAERTCEAARVRKPLHQPQAFNRSAFHASFPSAEDVESVSLTERR